MSWGTRSSKELMISLSWSSNNMKSTLESEGVALRPDGERGFWSPIGGSSCIGDATVGLEIEQKGSWIVVVGGTLVETVSEIEISIVAIGCVVEGSVVELVNIGIGMGWLMKAGSEVVVGVGMNVVWIRTDMGGIGIVVIQIGIMVGWMGVGGVYERFTVRSLSMFAKISYSFGREVWVVGTTCEEGGVYKDIVYRSRDWLWNIILNLQSVCFIFFMLNSVPTNNTDSFFSKSSSTTISFDFLGGGFLCDLDSLETLSSTTFPFRLIPTLLGEYRRPKVTFKELEIGLSPKEGRSHYF